VIISKALHKEENIFNTIESEDPSLTRILPKRRNFKKSGNLKPLKSRSGQSTSRIYPEISSRNFALKTEYNGV
jgi:hypothetical protein